MFKKIPLWVLLLILVLFIIIIPIYGFILSSSLKTGIFYRTILGNSAELIANFPRQVYYSLRYLKTSPDKIKKKENLKQGLNFTKKIKFYNTLILTQMTDSKTNMKYVALIEPNLNEKLHEWKLTETEINNFFKKKDYGSLNTLEGINLPILDLKDGSIVFRFSFEESGYMAKIDKNSKILWIVKDFENDSFKVFHHDYGIDDQGNIYSPVIMSKKHWLSNFLKRKKSKHLEHTYEDHGYVKISKDGEIEEVVSITDILIENGLGIYIYGTGILDWDGVHLNDVEPALFDGVVWKKNDLLISARNLSLVFIYRPSTKKIIWYKFGPWINQHDPDFVDYKTITVFGNDIIFSDKIGTSKMDDLLINLNKKNNIWKYDFLEKKATKIYSHAISKSKYKTYTGGYHYFDGKNFLSNFYSNAGVAEFYSSDDIVGTFVQLTEDDKINLVSGISFIKFLDFPNWTKYKLPNK